MPDIASRIAQNGTMMRVTVLALTRTVSFQPDSLASGGIAGPR